MKSFFKLWPFIIFVYLFFSSCTMVEEAPLSPEEIYISVPDTHFETALIEQGIDSDGLLNQQISQSDAEVVTRLDLNLEAHFGEIADLSGIEGFVNLTYLSAVGQQLETIDLSANPLLDTVYLSANYLTSIDIRHLPNLQVLELLSNELTSIVGLSEAINLKLLNLSYNYLEELSVDNASLETLLATNNLLQSIDIQSASHLKNLLLTSNQLSTVDFSNNENIETLVLSDNQLTNLALTQNTQLKLLYASSNILTSLDVSNNPGLIDLRVDRNPHLNCIKIQAGQDIPTVSIDAAQELNESCE